MNFKRIAAAGALAASLFICTPFNAASAAEPFEALPEDIFQWVQATPRASYYFNKQAMTYEIGPDGYADTNILLVPVVYLYDDMQVKDVIMKRQWRDLSTYRFANELIGSSELLRIDLTAKTVQHTQCTFLDQGYNSLYASYERADENINELSAKDVDNTFYQAILEYEQQHRKEILERIADKIKPETLKAAGIKIDNDKKSDDSNDKTQKKHRQSKHDRR